MTYEAAEIVAIMERLLEQDDATAAWYLQSEFCRIWNKQEPNSPERESMNAVWQKMMYKWH
jgi:hypothetical protein